ncbi:MAG: hypothetical protein OXC61_04200 [Flavobacteriaceae bacterium]|nr:hypothetical protein [Flavobacteriaceae bacterium]
MAIVQSHPDLEEKVDWLREEGLTLHFEKETYEAFAEKTIQMKTGARSIQDDRNTFFQPFIVNMETFQRQNLNLAVPKKDVL